MHLHIAPEYVVAFSIGLRMVALAASMASGAHFYKAAIEAKSRYVSFGAAFLGLAVVCAMINTIIRPDMPCMTAG